MSQSFRTNPTLKAISGASSNYIRTKDQIVLRRIRPKSTGPNDRLPDFHRIKCTAEGNFPLQLSFIKPELRSSSLLSIGQLWDEDYSEVFTKQHVKIFDHQHKLALTEHRNHLPVDGSWDINFPPSTS